MNGFMETQVIKVKRISDTMTAETEKRMVREYKSALVDLKSQMARIYEKYEVDGKLTYNEMAKYNRLESMIKDANGTLKDLLKVTDREITNNTKGLFEENYYRMGYTLESEAGAKLSFGVLNPKVVQAAVENPISGLTLSETLKSSRPVIITKIRASVTQGLIQGESYAKMAKRIQSTLEEDATKAMRIVRTEGHRAAMQGTLAAADHAARRGVEFQKEWLATLDARTRDTHGEMDGQIADKDGMFRSSSGAKAPAPGMFGVAAEDINCRCGLGYILPGAGDTTTTQKYSEWAEEHNIKPVYKEPERIEPSRDERDYGTVTVGRLESLAEKTFKDMDSDAFGGVYQYTTGKMPNGMLRRHNGVLSEGTPTAKQVAHIDRAMELAPRIDDNIRVYRGCTPEALGMTRSFLENMDVNKLKDMFVGSALEDHGYVSTTVSGAIANRFSKGIKMDIMVPKGSKALPINGKSRYKEEKEVLLPRNAVMEIVDIKKDKSTYIFKMLYVGG